MNTARKLFVIVIVGLGSFLLGMIAADERRVIENGEAGQSIASGRTWDTFPPSGAESNQAFFDKAVADGKDCRWLFEDGPESGDLICIDPTKSSVTIQPQNRMST